MDENTRLIMRIKSIRFADEHIYVLTDDGRELSQSLLYYPRLLGTSDAERADYRIGAFGIRWEKLDEDMSFESFEYPESEPSAFSRFFLTRPELNVSTRARRAGINASLMAQYVVGTKRPSEEQKAEIAAVLRQLGRELLNVEF